MNKNEKHPPESLFTKKDQKTNNNPLATFNKRELLPALIALLAPALFALIYFVLLPDPPWMKIIYTLSRAHLILCPVLWHILVDKQPFPLPRFSQKGIDAGIFSGVVIGLTAMILYATVFQNRLPLDMVSLRADQMGLEQSSFYLFSLFIIIVNSSTEEYYWRWFGLTKLKAVCKPLPAIILSGIGFALHHIIVLSVFFGIGYGLFFGLFTAIGGWIWAWMYDHYDSVWPVWISHAIVDLALMAIGFDMIFAR